MNQSDFTSNAYNINCFYYLFLLILLLPTIFCCACFYFSREDENATHLPQVQTENKTVMFEKHDPQGRVVRRFKTLTSTISKKVSLRYRFLFVVISLQLVITTSISYDNFSIDFDKYRKCC